MASAACIKMAGVPVEFNVATILEATMALLPTPDTITLPLHCKMCCTACANWSSKRLIKFATALLSISRVRFAMDKIDLMSLKV